MENSNTSQKNKNMLKNVREKVRKKLRQTGEAVADYAPEMLGVLTASVTGNAFAGAAASTAARRLLDRFLKANKSQDNQKFPENIQEKLSRFSFDRVKGVYGGHTAHLAGEIPTWNYTPSPDYSL